MEEKEQAEEVLHVRIELTDELALFFQQCTNHKQIFYFFLILFPNSNNFTLFMHHEYRFFIHI